jgi:flagellar assembly protein FliH
MRRIDATEVAMEPLWQAPAAASNEITPGAMVERLEAERGAVLESAYREGHDLGLKRAKELFEKESSAWQAGRQKEIDDLKRQLDAAHARLEGLIKAIPGQVIRQAEQAEDIAIEVAYAALAKLLGDQYQGGEVLRALVHDGIRQAGHTVTAIRVASVDAGQLAGMEIPVIADARLSPGECVLETAYGHQACGLDVRLDSLKRALLLGLVRHRDSGRHV